MYKVTVQIGNKITVEHIEADSRWEAGNKINSALKCNDSNIIRIQKIGG